MQKFARWFNDGSIAFEYENTMHDLLGIDVDLKDLLPEDQSAGGFDNNGAALAISAELFERYLEAARRGLDAAIQTGQRPESKNNDDRFAERSNKVFGQAVCAN